ncbi:DUF4873 domain-containing protein [Mycolicibacterium bacteremicum]|uniref:DUF4873 domain-containing protein n=1 Tax=Mycolicibacterium bacteremicum TaxID=564198 RepID=UPI0026EF4772|nr:DUF4873 domain-containing protein [Mycolicibacterium bacteremicum]
MMHDDGDGYLGPAELLIDGQRIDVNVLLAGGFQPIDGRYHWFGRIAQNDELTQLVGTGSCWVVLTTSDGHVASGLARDSDLWNRYRIEGLGMPPFPVPLGLGDITETVDV